MRAILAFVWVFAALLLVIAMLAGCETLKPAPELLTRVDTVTVRVPVPIPCVDAAEKPEIPATNLRPAAPGLTPHQQLARYIEQLRADVNDWRDYGIRADAILNSCIAKTAPPKEQP